MGNRAWREANRDRLAAANHAWYEAHKDSERAKARVRAKANKARKAQTHRAWNTAHPDRHAVYVRVWEATHRAERRAIKARRRASELRQIAPWADFEAIRLIYVEAIRLTQQTGIDHHVDHVIPLQGKLVSGLHVETNLQILTASANRRKHNCFNPATKKNGMTMQISTLRPGLLVSLKTSLAGNVAYQRRDIETDHIAEDGTARAKWETDRVIADPGEYDRATKVRSKARSLITAVCTPSNFGLLCPEGDRDRLTDAMAQAREIVAEFNREASLTQVAVFMIVGRVAADDVEAVRAINSEIRDLMTTMERGLVKLDVKVVREAADKAKELSAMLSPEAAERAQRAISVARSAARKIVKAGEAAALEIDEATLNAIRTSRTAFLDMDDQAEIQAPTVTGRAIDLEPGASEAIDNIAKTVADRIMALRTVPAIDWED